MRFNPYFFLLFIGFLITSCKYSTPPEMLIGNWYVSSVKANGHEMIHDYLDDNTRYLIFEEDGSYRIGLLDSAREKNWMIKEDKNELLLMHGSPFNEIKTWKVKASDELIYMNDKNGHFKITLNRRKELPQLKIIEPSALVGKWIIDKVTVNGYNNTDKYAFPNRWILLADNGRFYNGNNTGDQNVGYWKPNSSLTKINFYDNKDYGKSFISFNIAEDKLWYEKQNEDKNKPQVRIYFRKEE